MRFSHFLFFLWVFTSACSNNSTVGNNDTDSGGDSDSDSENTDSFYDSDSNSDSDSGSDFDSDSNIGQDTDSGTDLDSDSEYDSESDSNSNSDSESDFDSDSDSDTEEDTDTNTDTGTESDTGTNSDTDTDTETETETETESFPLAGLWVSRSPGAYFSYDVLDISETTMWESASNLSHISHFSGTITEANLLEKQFHVVGNPPQADMSFYCAYTDISDGLTVYYSESNYPEPTGGIEGLDFYSYAKVEENQCRRYVAFADANINENEGTMKCGYSADMTATYCYISLDGEEFSIMNGYETFSSYLNEQTNVGHSNTIFQRFTNGYESSQYDVQGRLTTQQGESSGSEYTKTFTDWDTAGRPTEGTFIGLSFDCSDVPTTIAYDDNTHTMVETILFENGTGTECPSNSHGTTIVTDAAGTPISRIETEGITITRSESFTNLKYGIACEFNTCPNPALLSPDLANVYNVAISGDWTGSAVLTVAGQSATLSDVNISMTAGGYHFISSTPINAFCAKQFGDSIVLAFEEMILTTPPGVQIKQVFHIALPIDEFGQSTINGTYNHNSWLTGTHTGTLALIIN